MTAIAIVSTETVPSRGALATGPDSVEPDTVSLQRIAEDLSDERTLLPRVGVLLSGRRSRLLEQLPQDTAAVSQPTCRTAIIERTCV